MNDFKLNPADFLDGADMKIFEHYLGHPGDVLMEMTNVRGRRVVHPGKLPFSFYFSDKYVVHQAHGIRVKLFWNPDRALRDADGYMELHGNYNYVQLEGRKPSAKEITQAREFFKTFKVLFAAVWEGVLDPADVQSYFEGNLSFSTLRNLFWEDGLEGGNALIKRLNKARLQHSPSVKNLEGLVRRYKMFNMND